MVQGHAVISKLITAQHEKQEKVLIGLEVACRQHELMLSSVPPPHTLYHSVRKNRLSKTVDSENLRVVVS